MYKHKYIAIALGAALTIAPLIGYAQTDVDVTVDVGAALDAKSAASKKPAPKADVRNAALQGVAQAKATTSTTGKPAIRPLKATTSPSMMLNKASTSARQIHQDVKAIKSEIRDARKEVRKDAFEKMRLNLIMQAEQALANLNQIRNRIADRIVRAEGQGRNMTDAKAKLVIADQKITLAEQAIAALGSYAPVAATTTASTTVSASTTPTSTTTPTVSLEKPRQIGSAAIEAIKTARRALQEVVVAIAKNMGLKIGPDGRVATSTGTTTSTTATTTTTTGTTTDSTATTTTTTATTTDSTATTTTATSTTATTTNP